MKNYLKKIISSIKNIYYYYNNKRLIKYLRQKGFSIGENYQLFTPKSIWLDSTSPFLSSKKLFSNFHDLEKYLKIN